MKTDIKSPQEILDEHFKPDTADSFFDDPEVIQTICQAMEAYHAQFSDAPKGAESEIRYVRITQEHDDPLTKYWYNKHVGKAFEIIAESNKEYCVKHDDDGVYYVDKIDCEILVPVSSLSSSKAEVLTDKMIEKQYPTKVNINNGIYPTRKQLDENNLKSEGAKWARDYINNKTK